MIRLARSRAFDQPHLCLAAGDDFLRVESPGPVAGCWPLGPGPPFRVAALEHPRVRLPRSLPGDGATGPGLDVPGGVELLGDGRHDAGAAGYASYPGEPFVFGFGFGLFYAVQNRAEVVGPFRTDLPRRIPPWLEPANPGTPALVRTSVRSSIAVESAGSSIARPNVHVIGVAA